MYQIFKNNDVYLLKVRDYKQTNIYNSLRKYLLKKDENQLG